LTIWRGRWHLNFLPCKIRFGDDGRAHNFALHGAQMGITSVKPGSEACGVISSVTWQLNELIVELGPGVTRLDLAIRCWFEPWIHLVKLVRAHGGCLGIRR
jgi:hypothetical protein